LNTAVTSVAAPSSAAPPPPAPPIVPPIEQQQQVEPIVAQEKEAVSEAPAVVSPPPQGAPKDLPVVSKEERIEYRDENGRVLDDEEVAALAGKVSFKTRYETRTRVIDGSGNEIYEGLVEAHGAEEEPGVAPPHPDAEGRNPETQEDPAASASDTPPTVEVKNDQQKEQSVEQQKQEAKPASEPQAATKEE